MNERDFLIACALEAKGEYETVLKLLQKRPLLNKKSDVSCLTILDEDYPAEFRLLKYPPFVLFYKGDITLLKANKISIVGSRNPCRYACEATLRLAGHTNEVVVSGLAKGIDSLAHQAAKRTIAILGSGIDNCYPKTNHDLYRKIAGEGLILSEYPADVLPLKHHFPWRNRLIAALGSSLYLMEVRPKSGSLSTLNAALELNRDIYVLPFSLFEAGGAYNNQLIAEGAQLICRQQLGLTSDI